MTDVLGALPDEPACIEARAMLLSGRGHVIWRDRQAVVLHAPDERLATILGPFRWTAIDAVLAGLGEVEVVARESEFLLAGPLPAGWAAERAVVHAEGEQLAVHRLGRAVTLFTTSDPPDLRHLPFDLRQELEAALAFSPVAAALDGDVPVSFCYAGWETDSWWDVSIDTLVPWRNRGYAAAASLALMTYMRGRGKRAVWAALESNVPSLCVARRLGFRPVARLMVVTPAGRDD
jgi:hypothetical protein